MLDKFKSALKQSGRSITTSRILLFEYLQYNEAVPLKKFVAENLKIADQASLYRSLQLFRQLGVIEERFSAGTKIIELSDLYSSHHHHLTCQMCCMVIAIHEHEQLETWIAEVSRDLQFTATSHQLEIRGFCSKCSLLSSK